jgi:hypothetical protein
MKDFTTTSFGLVIAYLLPGLVTLFSMSAWSENLRRIFRTLFSGQVDAGLLVSVGGCALVLGLVLNVFRWLTFERLICKKYKVAPTIFSKSSSTQQLQSFLMVIEETFRYHQFYGSIAILTPFLYLSWLRFFETLLINDSVFLWATFMFIMAELFFSWLLYESECGATEVEWIVAVCRLRWLRTGARAFQLIVLLLYSLELKHHFGSLAGRYKTLAVTVAFTFGGIAVAANAMAAQRRYSERANNLAGG